MHTKAKFANRRDLLSGILFVTIALTGLILNRANPLGTAADMGAGYFPMLAFSALLVLGIALLGIGIFGEERHVQNIAWRELVLIVGSTIVFGVCIERLGFIPSVFLTVIVGMLADRTNTIKDMLFASIGMVLLTWLIFIVGLGLNIPLFF